MSREINIGAAAVIAEAAFRPLDCVAEVTDYQHRLGFRVYDTEGHPIVTVEELLRSQVTDPKRLEAILCQTRERLEEKGYTLAPWSFADAVAESSGTAV